MNVKMILTHLAAAGAAFGLAWALATGGPPADSGDPAIARTSGDPATDLETALSIKDPIGRAAGLADFFERTDPSAALGLHEILRERSDGLYVDAMAEMLFASWWSKSDPKAAFMHPVNPSWAHRHPWMRTTFSEWTLRDPIAAALAVQKMEDGPLKGRLGGARAVVDTWLELDEMPEPTALLGVIKQLEPMARGGAIAIFLDTLVKNQGIDAMLDFVRDIPPDNSAGGNVQHEILARTGVVLLDHDLDRAIAWAEEQKDGPNASGVQKHLAYYWGLRDGRAAIEWALALPDENAKSMVVKRAWLSFSRKHRDEAKTWISNRDPDPIMRGIYADFIRTQAASDAESAIALANRAQDEELRQILLIAAGKGWMTTDPEAARLWQTSQGLPSGQLLRARP